MNENNAQKRKYRTMKTKTIVQQLAGKRVSDMLPDKDKSAIMNWLLQMPFAEINTLAKDPATPSFVVKCATMLNSEPLEKYFDMMMRCRMISAEGQNDN